MIESLVGVAALGGLLCLIVRELAVEVALWRRRWQIARLRAARARVLAALGED